jgi:two-component sensor histidine kinase
MAIRESQHRVQAMALIHQKLYQAEGVAHIPMKAYVEEVVAYLHEAYGPSSDVQLHLTLEDTELDVIRAVPLGLIINEAISNAFKYAFPGGRSGTVRLSLRESGGIHELIVADDGVGLPPHFDRHQSRSLGMTLLHGFGQQLGGKVSITSPPGTTVCLVFGPEQHGPD